MARASKTAPPTTTVELPTNGDAPRTFTHKIKGSTVPIELPLDGFDIPRMDTPEGRIWYYDFGNLDVSEKAWCWLRLAKVPRPTAHRVAALEFDEQFDLINGWLAAKTGIELPE